MPGSDLGGARHAPNSPGGSERRGSALTGLGTKLLLILLVAGILVFGTPQPFTTKHLLIVVAALLVVFGTPVLKALLVRLHIW
jgi:hypothetical protein